jgi:hypothetical protein
MRKFGFVQQKKQELACGSFYDKNKGSLLLAQTLAEVTLSDLPACLPAGRPAGRLNDFKFFIPLLSELRCNTSV